MHCLPGFPEDDGGGIEQDQPYYERVSMAVLAPPCCFGLSLGLANGGGRAGRGPDLVGVTIGAGPELHDIAVVERLVGEVDAEARALLSAPPPLWTHAESNAVVVGVVPALAGGVGLAEVDLDLRAVVGVCV